MRSEADDFADDAVQWVRCRLGVSPNAAALEDLVVEFRRRRPSVRWRPP